MTWGEFKQQVEAQGVKDEFEILYLDVSSDFGQKKIVVEFGIKTKFSVVDRVD